MWDQIRETKLNEELDRVNRFKRLRRIEQITSEMAEKEERLWFFENEDKMDVELEKAELRAKEDAANAKTKKTKAKKNDESYVPPEVGAKRN